MGVPSKAKATHDADDDVDDKPAVRQRDQEEGEADPHDEKVRRVVKVKGGDGFGSYSNSLSHAHVALAVRRTGGGARHGCGAVAHQATRAARRGRRVGDRASQVLLVLVSFGVWGDLCVAATNV